MWGPVLVCCRSNGTLQLNPRKGSGSGCRASRRTIRIPCLCKPPAATGRRPNISRRAGGWERDARASRALLYEMARAQNQKDGQELPELATRQTRLARPGTRNQRLLNQRRRMKPGENVVGNFMPRVRPGGRVEVGSIVDVLWPLLQAQKRYKFAVYSRSWQHAQCVQTQDFAYP